MAQLNGVCGNRSNLRGRVMQGCKSAAEGYA